jgi:hypothetical protein
LQYLIRSLHILPCMNADNFWKVNIHEGSPPFPLFNSWFWDMRLYRFLSVVSVTTLRLH